MATARLQQNRNILWTYRPAIDGLRSIAVISVLLFHFNRNLLGGGFVGVDVFFVLSGYLLTSILLVEIKIGDFSIARFYQRRIARIFPAFFFVIVVTLGFSFIVYSAQDFASLGANTAAAALSIINIKLLFQGSYFKLSEDAQPILHYWSLAVEEQFYLIFPIYLYLITRFSRRTFAVNLGICGMSFAACVLLTYSNPSYAFYLLPTRGWELLAGSSLAIFERQGGNFRYQTAAIASWCGLALLVLSFTLFEQNDHFPGWIAFFPVFGTVLVLSAVSHENLPLVRYLSHPLPVAIGKLSYSLYLWHWPTYSLVDYQFFQHGDLFRGFLKIAITLFASVATYRFVERPLRTYFSQRTMKPLAFASMAGVVTVLCATGIFVRNSYYFNATPSRISAGGTKVNGGNAGVVVLAGDSQASMYGKDLASLARKLKFTLNILSVDGGNELPQEPATHWPEVYSFIIQRRPDVVILADAWSEKIGDDPAQLQAALLQLKGHAGHVILLTQQPGLPAFASRQGIRNGARAPFFESSSDQEKRLAANAIVGSFSSDWVTVVDVYSVFVDRENVIRLFGNNGRLTFQDAGHLSDTGTAIVHPFLERAITNVLKR